MDFHEPNHDVEASKIRLADGRVAYDAVKLAQAKMEGVFLKDIPPNSRLLVQTRHNLYQFDFTDAGIMGFGGQYLPKPVSVVIHGSTWAGSMLKIEFVGVDMHLEFHPNGGETIITSTIQSIRITEIPCEPTKN